MLNTDNLDQISLLSAHDNMVDDTYGGESKRKTLPELFSFLRKGSYEMSKSHRNKRSSKTKTDSSDKFKLIPQLSNQSFSFDPPFEFLPEVSDNNSTSSSNNILENTIRELQSVVSLSYKNDNEFTELYDNLRNLQSNYDDLRNQNQLFSDNNRRTCKVKPFEFTKRATLQKQKEVDHALESNEYMLRLLRSNYSDKLAAIEESFQEIISAADAFEKCYSDVLSIPEDLRRCVDAMKSTGSKKTSATTLTEHTKSCNEKTFPQERNVIVRNLFPESKYIKNIESYPNGTVLQTSDNLIDDNINKTGTRLRSQCISSVSQENHQSYRKSPDKLCSQSTDMPSGQERKDFNDNRTHSPQSNDFATNASDSSDGMSDSVCKHSSTERTYLEPSNHNYRLHMYKYPTDIEAMLSTVDLSSSKPSVQSLTVSDTPTSRNNEMATHKALLNDMLCNLQKRKEQLIKESQAILRAFDENA